MDEPLWSLSDVELRGAEGSRLADVSLSISSGITAVLGPSGAGKTSLLNLLVGYERPSDGEIARRPGEEPRLDLFWSPPSCGLWPHLDAREHLLSVFPGDRSEAECVAEQILDDFDLQACRRALPARLSHGQRQRLSIARAIATNARTLVLDEPLVHVDASRGRVYWQLLLDHVDRIGGSLIYSTHDPTPVLADGGSAICLCEGRVIYTGSAAELRDRPPSLELARYLGDANWFTAAGVWLEEPHSGCVRPNHLEVLSDPTGYLVVESSRSLGPTCESELRHADSGQTARFVHRPGAAELVRGARVRLRLCALLVSLLAVCCDRSAVPDLPITTVRYHAMPPLGSRLPAPRSIAPGLQGEWVVLDTAGRVLVLSDEGELRRQWMMPEYEVGRPEGVCVLQDRRIVVADTHYSRLVFFDQQGELLSMQGEYGEGPGQFIYPVRVIQDDDGFIYVAEYGSNDRIQKFTPDGEFMLAFGGFGTEPGEFQRPSGLAWRDGKVFVADAMNNRIQVFEDDGELLGALHGGGAAPRFRFPYDLVIGPDGHFYVVEYGGGCLTALNSAGEIVGRFGSPGNGPAQLSTPWALAAVTERGILIADTGNHRIVEVRL